MDVVTRGEKAVIMRIGLAACVLVLAGCSLIAPATPQPTTAPTASPSPALVATPTVEPSPSPTAAPTATIAPTASGYAGSGWTATAIDLEPAGATFVFECPPGGSVGVVWGTDVYTADSSVCSAAVHAGVIDLAAGGDVTIEMRPGQEAYEGSFRNGVASVAYSSYDSSFVVIGGPEPSPAGSPSASASPEAGFGPFTLLFSDDFSDPTSGWGTGTLDSGTIAYEPSGVLAIDVIQMNQALRSTHELTGDWNVLRIEATMTPDGEGMFGLMCGESINEMVGALVTSTGGIIFAELDGGVYRVLARDDDAGVLVISGLPTPLAVECAGTSTGSTRMRIEVDGELVGTYDGGSEGPASYGAVGVYGAAVAETYSVDVDELTAAGGSGANLPPPAATASPSAVSQLLAHVPAAFRDRCQETPVPTFDQGAIVAVACSVEAGPGAEIIEYVQFDGTESMNAAYQSRVSFWGAEATGTSCQTGPSEHVYTIAGTPAGRLLCAPQTSGIRFDWTDERLNILSTATDFESSYADLWTSWLGAGPHP